MVKTNEDIIGEQCIRNDDVMLGVSDKEKKIAGQSDHEKLLNKEFAWNRYSLSQADAVSRVCHLIDKDMLRESISKMKNEKPTGPSGSLSRMVKAPG